ncbi:50S ribosomal protein L21 [Brucella sp. BE17]|uniref:50S ribosomal protein L21 n=1 Tax=Brucella sp. BE17 TaxID=3142977 RepID=UPI0031BA612D
MPSLIIQLAILIAVAFVIGCILGRVLRRRSKHISDAEQTIVAAALALPVEGGTPEATLPVSGKEKAKLSDEVDTLEKPVVPDAEVVGGELPAKDRAAGEFLAPEPVDEHRPPHLEVPRRGKPDDLTVITGIGKAVEGMLNEIGIFHYAQIADWSSDNSGWVERHIGFPRRIARENWIGQATKLVGASKKSGAARKPRAKKSPAKPRAKSVKTAQS